MVRLAEGYEALEEERNSATERTADVNGATNGAGTNAAHGPNMGKIRARQQNPHRKRGAVRDSDMEAAARFAEENGLAYN